MHLSLPTLSSDDNHDLETTDVRESERKSRREAIPGDDDEKDDSFGSESSSTTSSSSTSSSESESDKKVDENSNESIKEIKKHAPTSASSSLGTPFDLDEASGTDAIDNHIELSFEGLFAGVDSFAEDPILRVRSNDYPPAHDIEDFDELVNAEEEVVSETSQGVKRRRRRRRMYRDDKAPFVLEIGE
jgi:hypothetical protein